MREALALMGGTVSVRARRAAEAFSGKSTPRTRSGAGKGLPSEMRPDQESGALPIQPNRNVRGQILKRIFVNNFFPRRGRRHQAGGVVGPS
jgi:hypothetical protein